MPILAMSAGTVTAIWGSAFIRQADGSLKPVKVGDKVAGGEHIITDADGLVQISPAKGHPPLMVKAQAQPEASVEKTIAGVESQDPQDAPAAGLIGGADGGMQPGLRVERVSESLTPSALSLSGGDAGGQAATVQTGSSADQRALPSEAPAQAPASQASIDDIVVNEGTGTATFTVTLDKAATATVTIPFSTKTGTASDGDFTPTSGTLSFAPGETSKTIIVAIKNDEVYEGEERFSVQLGAPTNAVLLKGEGAVLIHDDGSGSVADGRAPDNDQPRVLSVSDAQTTEGGALAFHVQLSNASTTDTPLTFKLTGMGDHPITAADLGEITVLYSPRDADGQNGPYLPLQATVDSDGTVHVSVPALTAPSTDIVFQAVTKNDFLVEGTETAQLAVNSVYDATPVVATGMVDDNLPYVITGVSTVEGGHVHFNVTISEPSTEPMTVHLALASGVDDPYTLENESATLGQDTGTALEWQTSTGSWEAVTGPLTIPVGETELHLRLSTVDDKMPEVTEFIKLLATFEDPRFDHAITVVNQTAIDDNDPWPDPVNHTESPPDPSQLTSKTLTGHVDQTDVFAWHLSSQGVDHGVDTVEGFDSRERAAHGDVLDLRDILHGEERAGADLTNFLHFDTSGPDTVLKIAADGDMVDGHSASNVDSQHIVLEGVNLPADLGFGANATDAQIIAKLMQQGNLLVDHA